jgi:arabinose-5-phosphate isomerase
VGDCMTKSPISTQPNVPLGDAVRKMEDRSSQISVLPVLSEEGKLLGLLRLHDAYQPSFS